MCDTLCAVDGERLLFAKNSDRPVGEMQLVEQWARRAPSSTHLRTQYLDVGPDPGARAACVGSRPAWLWGFEHGLSEHGVAIGNEKIWTTDDPRVRPKALLGMDLVRLGLERARSADEALDVISSAIEAHGQGGTGEEHHDEPYDNAFLVADPARAWIVETSDRRWAARSLDTGGAAISNRVSLGTGWTRASPDVAAGTDIQTWRAPEVPTARADGRLAATTACISASAPSALHPGAVVATLRDHGRGPWGDPRGDTSEPTPVPVESRDDGFGITVCMHTRDTLKVTTASMVCEVRRDTNAPARAAFALNSPCVSIYVPVFEPSIAVPAALSEPGTWLAFDHLRARVEAEGEALAAIRAVLDPVETELWADADRQFAAGSIDPTWPDRASAKVTASLERLLAQFGPHVGTVDPVNRLAHETSPYLRQHADNPVDWFAWGDDAFAEARRRDVPVFLSVGYSSCHWCHVMAHESFEDAATADVMNRLFVNVKVDREERPDVDSVYMQATQAMTGRGGWPMSVWLRPDGRPFHAGTYFPKDDRQGMPGFVRVCEAVANAWDAKRSDVDDVALRLTGAIDSALPRVDGDAAIDAAAVDAAVDAMWESFDEPWGGFGPAPKFPPAVTLSWLCGRAVRSRDPERAHRARTMVTTTLDAMAAGGMYDQVGGGFARYSVDGYWLVPHFEKMLYDNALLTRAYVDGWRLTRNGRYARIVAETIEWTLRELRHPDGGFYAAYDADSEGVEGKYYCWSLDGLRDVVGDDADAVIEFYGATEEGNFFDPHTGFRGNVLHLARRDAEPDARIIAARERLRAARALRVPPGLDDKVLLSWNALMVRALVEAGATFQRSDWMDAARDTAEFLLTRLRRPSDGRLLRSWQASAEPEADAGHDGRARHLAYAEDYAALIDALVRLGELDAPRWLEPAITIADDLLARFHDDDGGGLFTTGSDAPALIVRTKDQMDDATPAASSVAAGAFLRLAVLTGDDRYRGLAHETLHAVAPFVTRYPRGFAAALDAAAFLTEPVREVVVVGPPNDGATDALQVEVASRVLPATVSACITLHDGVGDDDGGVLSPALVEGRGLVGGQAAAYVCEDYTCAAPVTEPDALGRLLDLR